MEEVKVKDMLTKGVSYEAFINKSEELLSTEALKEPEVNQKLRSNLETMEQILKETTLPFSLYKKLCDIETKIRWVVIAEPWCLDTANVLPLIYKFSEVTDLIDLHIVFRDENPEIMDQFLTNGKKAIPKLICFDKQYHKIGEWGPRVEELQNYINELKANTAISSSELNEHISGWYQTDRATSVFIEFNNAISDWLEGVTIE